MYKIIIINIFLLFSINNKLISQVNYNSLFLYDYIDIGNDITNNARTIEFWFKLNIELDSTNKSYITLMCRPNRDNKDAFKIWFASGDKNKHLAFTIFENSQKETTIYSNSKQWEINKYYHLMIVIDKKEGLMMFINGKKQNDTQKYKKPISKSDNPNYLGGGYYGISFIGDIKDFKTSELALYVSDFSPVMNEKSNIDYTFTNKHKNERDQHNRMIKERKDKADEEQRKRKQIYRVDSCVFCDYNFEKVDSIPIFEGGEKNFHNFINTNLIYPEIPKELGRQGITYVVFVVNKNGEVVDLHIGKGFDIHCDKEAFRVIKLTNKKWKPAIKNGVAVPAKVTLPVHFNLSKN